MELKLKKDTETLMWNSSNNTGQTFLSSTY